MYVSGMKFYGLQLVLLVTFIALVSGDNCAHLPESECPKRSVVCRCKRFDMNSVICCHVKSDFELKEGLACASKLSIYIYILLFNYNINLPSGEHFGARGCVV